MKATFVQNENLPTLVTFKNLSDPNSVIVVQPDLIEESLGKEVALKNVWLERTKEPTTKSDLPFFPWWEQKKTEWQHTISIGAGDPLIDQLFFTAFSQPNEVKYKGLEK